MFKMHKTEILFKFTNSSNFHIFISTFCQTDLSYWNYRLCIDGRLSGKLHKYYNIGAENIETKTKHKFNDILYFFLRCVLFRHITCVMG